MKKLSTEQANKAARLRALRHEIAELEKEADILRDKLRDELEAGSYFDPETKAELAVIECCNIEELKENAAKKEGRLSTMKVIEALELDLDKFTKRTPDMKKVIDYNKAHPGAIPVAERRYKQVKTNIAN